MQATAFRNPVETLVAYSPAEEVLGGYARACYPSLPVPVVEYLGYTPNVCPQTFVPVEVLKCKIVLFENMTQTTSNLLNEFKITLRMNVPGPKDNTPPLHIAKSRRTREESLHPSGTTEARISALDEYGFITRDLKGLVVWLADVNNQIIKALGRMPLREDVEFRMTDEDNETFRRIGCLLRVASYHLSTHDLFAPEDGPMYDANLASTPAPLDTAAKYLEVPNTDTHPVHEQPQWKHLESCWQQVCFSNTKESAELDLRAGDAAYRTLPSEIWKHGKTSTIPTKRTAWPI
ncbi:hypothetical protein QFC22_002417 [Naganishia vaughanmartiniae]|uniref:Uncharacterized protein n=1 Tax=Naganishia vaughanmartiniae TaxID=1424756 RepID=A0ACC2XCL1_9TREE|nr:hypothetical protein QFC22_002417 [Naganishia vaughanmartiniae]